MPGTWSFTFSWAAVAAAVLHWLGAGRPAGYQVWEYLVLAAISVLLVAIAARTVAALVQGKLLPAPPPPADPTPEPAGLGKSPSGL